MKIKKGLPTYCQLHPDDDNIDLSEPGAFRKLRPNGGCCRPCTYRMECGHVCPQACHPLDRSHKAAEMLCNEPCQRIPPECKMNHKCTKLCKDICGPCRTLVYDPVELPCGHTKKDPSQCHEVRDEEALKKLSDKCVAQVLFTFPNCNHKEMTMCWNAQSSSPMCPAICNAKLDCGHYCTNM